MASTRPEGQERNWKGKNKIGRVKIRLEGHRFFFHFLSVSDGSEQHSSEFLTLRRF